jgi:hypothetical protein
MKLAQIISLTNELTLRCDATVNGQVAIDATGDGEILADFQCTTVNFST